MVIQVPFRAEKNRRAVLTTQRVRKTLRLVGVALASALVLLFGAGCSQTNSSPPPIPDEDHPPAQGPTPSDEHGKAPVLTRINTSQPYVFISIDDGAVRDPHALALIKQSRARPTLFLNQIYVQGHESYFKELLDQGGATVGDHTVDHRKLRGTPLAFQRQEICDDATALQRELGQRPELFRPPFGSYDDNTRIAAHACGMKAIIVWSATVNNGALQFQQGNHLRRGDIVLMHFRPTFVQDYTAFLNEAKRDGLTPMPLPDNVR